MNGDGGAYQPTIELDTFYPLFPCIPNFNQRRILTTFCGGGKTTILVVYSLLNNAFVNVATATHIEQPLDVS